MDAKLSQTNGTPAQIVSIHAPVMDANTYGSYQDFVDASFNPRARDGREILLCIYVLISKFQSTRP